MRKALKYLSNNFGPKTQAQALHYFDMGLLWQDREFLVHQKKKKKNQTHHHTRKSTPKQQQKKPK